MKEPRNFFAHHLALVESQEIGANTRIWAFAHVMEGARVGSDCNIGEQCFIESGATLGNNVTVKNGVAVWSGVTVEDNVFLGPSCVLTNDPNPRAYIKKGVDALRPTRIGAHATIGANATLVCGVNVGCYAFVGAGAVVTHSIPDFALFVGNPARQTGWVCICAENLRVPVDLPLRHRGTCCRCGSEFERTDSGLGVIERQTSKVVSHSPSRVAQALRVPFVDLQAQYATIGGEVDAGILEVVRSGNFVGGVPLETFERDFAAFVGTEFAIGVGNGTDAITLALKAGGVHPGDEVLIPANSFFATAEAVSNAGAKPVFIDVDPLTFQLDPEATSRAIGPATRAILPVHLYGRALDMSPFEALARAHGLLIVEDCAQAHGAEFRGSPVGSSGRLTCYSFYPGKNLGAYGDGGAITTNNAEFNVRLRMLRDHGSPRKYEHALVGYNSRLDAIQAAVLSVKLHHLHRWNALRLQHARKYAKALFGSPILGPEIPEGRTHVFHLFVVRCRKRDQLQQFLSGRNIATGIHYPVPLHLTPAYQALGAPGRGSNPVAERLAGEILSLPMYAELSDAQIQHVVDSLTEFVRLERPSAPADLATAQLAW